MAKLCGCLSSGSLDNIRHLIHHPKGYTTWDCLLWGGKTNAHTHTHTQFGVSRRNPQHVFFHILSGRCPLPFCPWLGTWGCLFLALPNMLRFLVLAPNANQGPPSPEEKKQKKDKKEEAHFLVSSLKKANQATGSPPGPTPPPPPPTLRKKAKKQNAIRIPPLEGESRELGPRPRA